MHRDQVRYSIHPQINGQLEWTIQIFEDLLRSCVLDWGSLWDEHLLLVVFVYNNSYQASNGMSPFEAFYDRPYRSPTCWTEDVAGFSKSS